MKLPLKSRTTGAHYFHYPILSRHASQWNTVTKTIQTNNYWKKVVKLP